MRTISIDIDQNTEIAVDISDKISFNVEREVTLSSDFCSLLNIYY